MGKELISGRQGITIMVMFIIGSTLVIGGGVEAKQDVWIAISLAALMAAPVLFVYARLLHIFPGKDLFDIVQKIFGKVVGKIIVLLFTWYSLHLGALVVRNFSEFIEIVSMPETPQFIIIFFMAILCIWLVKSGIEVIGRWTEFVLPFLIIVIVGTIILSLTQMEVINIKPVLFDGFQPVLSGAFSTFSFPFAETVVFIIIFSSLKSGANKYKIYYLSLIIGGALILAASVRNILVLGVPTSLTQFFPSYSAVRLINIGDFFQRIEITVSVVFLLCGLIKISVCLFAASKGVATIFNFDNYKSIAAPVGLIMVNLACFIYRSTMEMFEWVKVYPYYAIPFQIVLPLIIFIAAEIKTRSKNKKVQ